MAKKKLFEGVSFDALCKRYLKEGADIADLADDEVIGATEETEADEFDTEMESPVDEFDAEEETFEEEGDVTVTLSADLISALRTILSLVDAEEGVDEVADEEGVGVDDEDMELDASDDVEPEVEVEETEGIYEEDEEQTISASTSAPTRKKGTPAINRKGTGEGDFSKVNSREGEPVTFSGAAPERKKGTPAIDRKGVNSAHKAHGKKALDIQG